MVERTLRVRKVGSSILGRVVPKTYTNGTSSYPVWRSALKGLPWPLLSYPHGDGFHQE